MIMATMEPPSSAPVDDNDVETGQEQMRTSQQTTWGSRDDDDDVDSNPSSSSQDSSSPENRRRRSPWGLSATWNRSALFNGQATTEWDMQELPGSSSSNIHVDDDEATRRKKKKKPHKTERKRGGLFGGRRRSQKNLEKPETKPSESITTGTTSSTGNQNNNGNKTVRWNNNNNNSNNNSWMSKKQRLNLFNAPPANANPHSHHDRYYDMQEHPQGGSSEALATTSSFRQQQRQRGLTTTETSLEPTHVDHNIIVDVDDDHDIDYHMAAMPGPPLDNHSPDHKHHHPKRTLQVHVPTLKKMQQCFLKNDEAKAYRQRARTHSWKAIDLLLDILSSLIMYLACTLTLESVVCITHAVLVTYFYCVNHALYAVKLDFSFLAFAVIFPLTFLIQSTFQRREEGLRRIMDFKACLLGTALMTFTTDWATKKGGDASLSGGRTALPATFQKRTLRDFRTLAQLVYEYLSMPLVSHARHIVFPSQQKSAQHVHAVQNEVVKYLNDTLFDIKMHLEIMRDHGFSSSEASRLHQYHQHLQYRFEQLRAVKYYRTPQATRAFGRAYMYVLPWLAGPYFAHVLQQVSSHDHDYAFTLTLAAFTYLILLGLLNTIRGMEDPFVPDESSGWTPGVDNIKLEYEFASTLQALEQYYARAEKRSRLRHVVSKLDPDSAELGDDDIDESIGNEINLNDSVGNPGDDMSDTKGAHDQVLFENNNTTQRHELEQVVEKAE